MSDGSGRRPDWRKAWEDIVSSQMAGNTHARLMDPRMYALLLSGIVREQDRAWRLALDAACPLAKHKEPK